MGEGYEPYSNAIGDGKITGGPTVAPIRGGKRWRMTLGEGRQGEQLRRTLLLKMETLKEHFPEGFQKWSPFHIRNILTC